jgi:hypothetical protein
MFGILFLKSQSLGIYGILSPQPLDGNEAGYRDNTDRQGETVTNGRNCNEWGETVTANALIIKQLPGALTISHSM